MTQRVLFSIALLFLIVFLPYYVAALFAVIGIFYFELYFEAVLLLFVGDLLYGVPENNMYHIVFVLALFGLVSFLGIELLKKKLTFYAQ